LLLAYMGTRAPAEPTSVIERAAQAAARARSETPPAPAQPAEARPAQTSPSEPQPPAIAPAPTGNK
jgi:rod shape-determining protein MreC